VLFAAVTAKAKARLKRPLAGVQRTERAILYAQRAAEIAKATRTESAI